MYFLSRGPSVITASESAAAAGPLSSWAGGKCLGEAHNLSKSGAIPEPTICCRVAVECPRETGLPNSAAIVPASLFRETPRAAGSTKPICGRGLHKPSSAFRRMALARTVRSGSGEGQILYHVAASARTASAVRNAEVRLSASREIGARGSAASGTHCESRDVVRFHDKPRSKEHTMPETRSNSIIEIVDEDRGINLTLSVDYDWLAEGAVENPTVEVVRGAVWFGKWGAALAVEDNGKQIAREIETRYAAEIVDAIVDAREAARWDSE